LRGYELDEVELATNPYSECGQARGNAIVRRKPMSP
jgi:hypothetical protein